MYVPILLPGPHTQKANGFAMNPLVPQPGVLYYIYVHIDNTSCKERNLLN